MRKPIRRLEVGKHIDYEKDDPCIASVEISRVAIFYASRKSIPTGDKVWEAKTPWGSVTVKGRLTQTHRSVLDAIFAFPVASARYMDKDQPGPATFLINPYEIAKKAGLNPTKRKWLEKTIFEDMRVASIELKDKKGETICCGGIISDWSRDESFQHRGAVGETSLLRVTISTAWMRLADETLGVCYASLVEKIGTIKSGYIQSMIRTFLTQSGNVKYSLDRVIEIAAGNHKITEAMSRQAIDKIKESIVSSRDMLENDFGIVLRQEEDESGRKKWFVLYSQHKDVRFSPPIKTQ